MNSSAVFQAVSSEICGHVKTGFTLFCRSTVQAKGVGGSIPVAPIQPQWNRRAQSKHVLLSSILKQAPQSFDRNKIAAVERFITDLDPLPARFQEAKVES